MSISRFSNPSFLIGSFAVVGFGGIAIAAWHTNSHPETIHDFLSEKGYFLNPSTAALEIEKKSSDNPEYMDYVGSYECFRRSFPQVERVVHSFEGREIDASEQKNVLALVEPSMNKGSSDPVGCALMQMNYVHIRLNNRNYQNFVFKSEVTVKNDRIG